MKKENLSLDQISYKKENEDREIGLVSRKTNSEEYNCEITSYLDYEAKMEENVLFKHYILADKHDFEKKLLAIRVPGGTVGHLKLDENNRIVELLVDTDYVVKTYPTDINDKIKCFIGVKIIT